MPESFRELIPHRPPMVLIDRVLDYGPEFIRASRLLRPGDPFVTPQGLEDAALIELIAQTIAAGDALYARSKGGRVQRGYLTGLTALEILGRAMPGEEITVRADCLKRMEGMGLFDAEAGVGPRVIARGRVKLYVAIDYGKSEPARPTWA